MAENVILNNVTTFTNDSTAASIVNANSSAIATAFVDTLSRSGVAPNQMQSVLDMNSNQIINLPAPSTTNSPARLIDVVSNPTIVVPATGTSGHVVPFLDGNNTWSGTQTFSSIVFPSAQQSLTFNRNAKSGPYTVVNSDKGSLLDLTGPAFYTVTLNAPSGYDANFSIYIVNSDTARAKTMAFSGLSNFFLWPGQSIIVVRDNNTWTVHGRSRFLSTGYTFYVDNVNGSATNDGLAPGAGGAINSFINIQTLAQQNLDPQGGSVSIQVAQTGVNYTETLTWFGGGGSYFLYSIAGAPGQTVVISGSHAVKDYAAVGFNNITFTPTQGNTSITVDQCGIVDVNSTVTFSAGGTVGLMSSANGGVINLVGNGCTFNLGGAPSAFVFNATSTGIINCTGISLNFSTGGSMTSAFAVVSSSGILNISGTTFSGAGAGSVTGVRYIAVNGGGINTGGGGANYLPGNSAGTATSPGWYA